MRKSENFFRITFLFFLFPFPCLVIKDDKLTLCTVTSDLYKMGISYKHCLNLIIAQNSPSCIRT